MNRNNEPDRAGATRDERLPPVEAVVIFTRVAETGSFTAAARSMGLPLATVSKRVAELEEHLGVTLIARTTRRSSLTEPGKRFLTHGQLIVDALQRAADEAAQAVAEPSGRLRLTMSTVLVEAGLGRLIARFVAANPKLRCEIDVSDRYVDLVAEGYDLAIRVGRLKDSTLIARKIGSTEASMFAAPSLVAERGLPSDPKALDAYPLIGEQISPSDTQQWLLHHATQKPAKIEFKPRMSANNVRAIAEAIEAGLGIGRLPTFVGRRMAEHGLAVPVLPEWAGPGLDISLVYAAHRGMLPGVRLLIDQLSREAGSLLPGHAALAAR
ncbi:LysR family transcriptional regulator [Aminobacter ciceronei]|jgi:LysR family transcriptional regulator for bpeEF and oprC|uniref:DNA-binding transcriptional LysR family regulator n=1 Tax=Aminobacter ciceronei TaxID=150723 RepID=A0ABR6CCU4_9HYPH|nr:LysR family transcriptional regulator [Aminobacter ciceronei]MBA8909077.1 DNA-binding transcriptional LysR family regulator [Aminobacter ciceronei]MBA9022849.1 DNA-binding transcriptional LysR family regulator [Aminobacter ciceronei]